MGWWRSLRGSCAITVAVLAVAGVPAAAATGAPDRATGTPAVSTGTPAVSTGAPAVSTGAPVASGQLALVLPLAVNARGLAAFAAAVTDPRSPAYEQYATIPWLARHFGVRPGVAGRTVAFLRRAGASGVIVDHTGLFVSATLPASVAERLFGTSLREVHAARGGGYTAPSQAPAIPAGLRGLVTGVVGLDTEPLSAAPAIEHRVPTDARSAPRSPAAGASLAAVDAFRSLRAPIAREAVVSGGSGYFPATGVAGGCRAAQGVGGFTPAQYLTAYGYPQLESSGLQGQGEKVALIEIDGFKMSDITTFAQCFGIPVPHVVGFRVGSGVAPTGLTPGGESTLDLEVLAAAAPKLQQIDVYETQSTASAVLRALTEPLDNTGYKPQVISASLGLCEAQTLEAVGRAGVAVTEEALEEAAASGISFLAASGDDGSADCLPGSATSVDSVPPIPQLAVNYPASSPWATGVGGTNFTLNSANAILSQTVWNDAGSDPGAAGGGGPSGLFRRPDYQNGTVSAAVREVPDVSMLADPQPGYDVYCTTSDCISASFPYAWQPVGGTSAATPLLAGGLAVIDEDLRLHKQQSLGLVNPLLYGIGHDATVAPSVFFDVTTGSNDVGPYITSTHRSLGCCSAGVGYDEASGWGSVNVAGLAAQALLRQKPVVMISERLPAHQRPLAARGLFVAATCTGACLAGAYARLTVDHRLYSAFSRLYTFKAAGQRILKVPLPGSLLALIRRALARHQVVRASLYAAIADPAGNIERQTSRLSLTITG